ncbi:hypothetical protein JHK82_053305 [Glycine max]|nr:hypothetical protein JHK82_053305 [Glycine max]
MGGEARKVLNSDFLLLFPALELSFRSSFTRFLFSCNFLFRIAPVCHCLQNQKGSLMSAAILF